MAKKRNSIIADANGTKIEMNGYFDLQTFKMKPVSDHYLSQLARSVINWLQADPEALTLEDFFEHIQMNPQEYYRWMPRSQDMQQAHEYAKMILGNRREKGGLKRKLDPGMVQASMPMYSKAWKDLTEWKAKLKEESGSQGNNITVVIDKVPDSPLVKEKK